MRKVDIRDRVQQLDLLLQRKKQTLAQQQDERERLFDECQAAGDHVFRHTYVLTAAGFEYLELCEFCKAQRRASDQQIARNLAGVN